MKTDYLQTPVYAPVIRPACASHGAPFLVRPVVHPADEVPLEMWQELASPVWNYRPRQSGRGDHDLPATDTLNVKQAADDKAEKHLCPMPLNITERALKLWINADDIVFSPFTGIGSEGVASMRMGRRFIGTELNPTYYDYAVKNITDVVRTGNQSDMFAELIA